MKNLLNRLSKVNRKSKGVTMIELLIAISIIEILTMKGGISGYNYLEDSRRIVCEANRTQVIKLYQMEYVNVVSEGNIDTKLKRFLIEKDYENLCPSGGRINVLDGELIWEVHGNDTDEGDDGSVPYLHNTIRLDE